MFYFPFSILDCDRGVSVIHNLKSAILKLQSTWLLMKGNQVLVAIDCQLP
jgi:hypothetical protein